MEVQAEDLVYCGQRKFHFEEIFHGERFKDNQISNVYLLWMDREAEEFQIQKEELSEVRWFDFEECIEDVKNGTIPNCIYVEELEMVGKDNHKTQKITAPASQTERLFFNQQMWANRLSVALIFSIDILACNVDNVKRILEQLVYFSSSGYFIPQSSLHLVMTCITSLV